jgi:hypothetical protein
MIANGFKNIVFLGDHGGGVGGPVLKPGEKRDPKAVPVNNGIEGDARRSTPEIGKKVSDIEVGYAVDEIHRLLP